MQIFQFFFNYKKFRDKTFCDDRTSGFMVYKRGNRCFHILEFNFGMHKLLEMFKLKDTSILNFDDNPRQWAMKMLKIATADVIVDDTDQ